MADSGRSDKFKKYLPYVLGIATILLVVIILTVGSTRKMAQSEEITVSTLASTTTHRCTKSDWIGDGFCDDETNTPLCDFDGNDCCMDNIFADYCSDCFCYMTDSKHEQLFTITTTTKFKPTGDASEYNNFEF